MIIIMSDNIFQPAGRWTWAELALNSVFNKLCHRQMLLNTTHWAVQCSHLTKIKKINKMKPKVTKVISFGLSKAFWLLCRRCALHYLSFSLSAPSSFSVASQSQNMYFWQRGHYTGGRGEVEWRERGREVGREGGTSHDQILWNSLCIFNGSQRSRFAFYRRRKNPAFILFV